MSGASRVMAALLGLLLVLALSLTGAPTLTPRAEAAPRPLTNLAHLDFLLDEVTPAAQAGHTTYRLGAEPTLTVPWTYADARDGGTFERVGGGGPADPVTGDYLQGAFNSDDITRAAVVYLRDWQLNRSTASRDKAYELLRAVAYFQTTTGPNAGQSVLWMQPDGDLNPSALPVELPDPSDSGPSYWQARTLWAYGEGYAAFKRTDPQFARFLQQRLQLSLKALDRTVLDNYGDRLLSDGARLPAWLIINGADVTAEAVLGLSAYVTAAPTDFPARRALSEFATGIAAMSAGDAQSWPYGAILPWAESRSMWHAWSSQTSAALARSSAALRRPALLQPAVTEAVSFDTTLLTAGGPDNAWYPTPVDRTQIAYGADSRVQSLLATADVARLPGLEDLAGLAAAWFFGANRAGEPMYDPATGVTYDGLATDGTINRNSGAESTMHGLLTMLALDAHPAVRTRAVGVHTVQSRDGLTVVEAEAATTTTGTVVTPESAWTGESQYGGGKYLALEAGQGATFDLGAASQRRLVEPVSWLPENGTATSSWRQGNRNLGVLAHQVGGQGVSEVPGALLPQSLDRPVTASAGPVSVVAQRGTVRLDSLIVRPLVSRELITGAGGSTELVHSASSRFELVRVGAPGRKAVLRSYDARGRRVVERRLTGSTVISLKAGGFAVVVE
ncbi:MAG: hypothetical protein ABWY56_16215 [Propionibacteriaceae bacterium]